MKITLDDTRRFAKDFLAMLKEEGISNVGDLQERVGYKIPFDNDAFVEVASKPANFGTTEYSLEFFIPRLGAPMGVRLNPKMDYSKVLLTCESEIPGYFIFSRDSSNNLRLMKILEKADLDIVKKELESL